MSNPAHSSEPSEELKTSGYGGDVDTASLNNSGELDLTLIVGSSTYTVKKGESRRLKPTKDHILVNAKGMTLSTIKYPDSSAFSVERGEQIEKAQFTLTITVSSD